MYAAGRRIGAIKHFVKHCCLDQQINNEIQQQQQQQQQEQPARLINWWMPDHGPEKGNKDREVTERRERGRENALELRKRTDWRIIMRVFKTEMGAR
jgi:hypothetical protein